MITQTREAIASKLDITRSLEVTSTHQLLVLELILDVLVDIRDSMQPVSKEDSTA